MADVCKQTTGREFPFETDLGYGASSHDWDVYKQTTEWEYFFETYLGHSASLNEAPSICNEFTSKWLCLCYIWIGWS